MAALLAATLPAAAEAQHWGRPSYQDRGRAWQDGRSYPPPGYGARGYGAGGYGGGDGRRGYDRDDRRRHCDRGTGGTIIGAIAGGLLGNSIAGRGDRGAGTIVGAGAGALAGRAIDRDC